MTTLREAAKAVLDRWDSSEYAASDLFEELRAALEQQQAEPVAYCYVKKGSSADALTFDQKPADAVSGTVFPLYTAPPQRKPLTGEEIEFAWMKAMQSTPGTTLPIHEFARAIEQARGIKETP